MLMFQKERNENKRYSGDEWIRFWIDFSPLPN